MGNALTLNDIWIAPTNTGGGGEFKHNRHGLLCAWVIVATAPVRHALPNTCRAREAKDATGSKRRDVNDCETIVQT
jgi:hypothetical protein